MWLFQRLKQSTNKAFKIEFASFNDYQKFLANTELVITIERPNQNQVKLNLTDEKMQHLFAELSEVNVNFISEIKFTLEDYFMDFYDREKTVAEGEENLHGGLY
ncbi:hypothetical protein ACEN4M_07170 [Marinilactibacillus psychrotolerans]